MEKELEPRGRDITRMMSKNCQPSKFRGKFSVLGDGERKNSRAMM